MGPWKVRRKLITYFTLLSMNIRMAGEPKRERRGARFPLVAAS